ncbi:hypothetical protein BpHYR1_001477 [Brachionus plicatilis]|uniref:Uncharacterized protein n=1 Tax=Brachionus plicatilis TaxID=10195 RepID=A0A3M7PSX4_BRAPC|nr:hypothetical protein BpHYR1_001477 [Brachionus plicatilis]
MFLPDLLNSIALHLLTLKSIRHVFDHSESASRSCCSVDRFLFGELSNFERKRNVSIKNTQLNGIRNTIGNRVYNENDIRKFFEYHQQKS